MSMSALIRQGVSTSRALMSQQDKFYPNVHRYTPAQREEITRHVYRHPSPGGSRSSRTRTTS